MQVCPPSCVNGEHVGFLDAVRVDALMRLDMGQRPEPVAEFRGALEFELFRRLRHQHVELFLHGSVLPRKEGFGLVDELRVVLERDLAACKAPAQRLIWKSRQGRVRLS